MTVKGKRVLVIGLGISGSSAAHFLLDQCAHVHGVDRNPTSPEAEALKSRGATIGPDSEAFEVGAFDLVIVSPGIPQAHPLCAAAREAGIETIGELELGCRFVKQRMIGVTGTNGKTTVTLLITHVLNQSGRKAKALGNVGVPLTKEIAAAGEDDILVAELSSYQLDTLRSPILDAAVILNVTPDHLDRYGDMEAYALSKFQIHKCLKPGMSLYVEKATLDKYGYFEVTPIYTYGYEKQDNIYTDLKSLYVNRLKVACLPEEYQGRRSHDLENVMAAFAMCRIFGVTAKQFFSALATFKKPSHRIEFVLERSGVAYYDDSKGTNIDAVIRAVEKMKSNVVIIAGGVDKGAAYTPWIDAFQGKVKAICAIGEAAQKIEHQLSHAIPVTKHGSLEEAVKTASSLAESGESVLLSPGCSSFDMFRDYVHRGEEFQRLVKEIDE